ncbi:VWA domain-containing protein [Rhizobium sp. Pop5]|uniref:VWA domain-containing protein n=1 Tax=Rhizobium sp. Pop5 TaxID=1223565 RepID=UPI000563315A|nr:VWA domain-containing protein [Rhizobium sp. Pop5]UVD56155.1 VWA domain-containing protein [Rhizobium sp. Pop5]
MTTFKLHKPEEEVRRVGFVLQKQGIHERIPAQVGINIDVSGSMNGLFKSGAVQAAIERILPVALYFDDDGRIDTWVFSNGNAMASIIPATAKNYEDYVEREIITNPALDGVLWGGTDYGPVIRSNLMAYGLMEEQNAGGLLGMIFGMRRDRFGEETRSGVPAINYFLTDGENADRDAAWELLEKAEHAESQIYYVMVGIGDERFDFLREAAEQFPNVGFVRVKDLGEFVGSDDAYQKLLPAELCAWLKHEHDDEDDDHH